MNTFYPVINEMGTYVFYQCKDLFQSVKASTQIYVCIFIVNVICTFIFQMCMMLHFFLSQALHTYFFVCPDIASFLLFVLLECIILV